MSLVSFTRRRAWRLAAALGCAVVATATFAQPSGGPYGPVQQRYELPKSGARLIFVAPDAKADGAGTSVDQPTSIESAVARAATGDVIILRGGTYRTGNLVTNQGITLQPYLDERPVLKGTRVASQWTTQRNGVWRTKWETLFPMKPADWWRREREGRKTPLHRFNNDMVFIDGRPLQSAGWEGEVDADSYYIDYENQQVYIGADPTGRVVEITAHDGALTRTLGPVHGRTSDGKGFTLRGLTLTQYAYRALEVEGREPEQLADPATFGKDVVGTTIEHCTITHCSRVAAYLRGDRTTVRHCLVSDTSTEGLYLISSADCLFERNIIARNNVEHITGYYPSAVKIFNQSYRVVCRENLVLDQPDSNGIWYDVGNVDGVVVNNWFENVGDGFFFEISKGAICAGNVFVNCDKGVRSLNSSNVHVYHNTFINTGAWFERDQRSAVGDHFGWHPSTGPDVDQRDGHIFVGNLVIVDGGYDRPLLNFEQSKVLAGKLTRPPATRVDYNVYVRRGPSAKPLFAWSPAATEDANVTLPSIAELQKLQPAFEAHGAALLDYAGPLVQSLELKRYAPHRNFPFTGSAAGLPDNIRELLGWKKDGAPAVGAYPTLP